MPIRPARGVTTGTTPGEKARILLALAVSAMIATAVIATTVVTVVATSTGVAHVAATSTVSTGDALANANASGTSTSTTESSAGAAIATGTISGTEKVYVSVVETTPQTSDDVNPAVSQSDAQTVISKLNSYWSAQSGGRVTVVLGGYETRSLSESTCAPNGALSSEQSAAFGGLFANDAWKGTHNHLLVLSAESCNANSFATVGGVGGEIFSGNGINSTTGIEYLLHEFGHNLGFEHADASICTNTTSYDGTAADFGFSSTVCPTREYDDYFDIMGYTVENATPNLSSPQRIMAGWVTNYDTLTNSAATVAERVTALSGSGGTQALKIIDPVSGDVYYVEYRTNSGLDATSAEFNYGLQCDPKMSNYTICELDSNKSTGVVRILRFIPFASSHANGTTVLATGLTAGSTDKTKRHTHLNSGDSFTSVDSGFTLKVVSLSPSSGASIQVTFPQAASSSSGTPSSSSSVTPSSSSRVQSRVAVSLAHTRVSRGTRESVRIWVSSTGATDPTGTVVLYVNGKAVHTYALKSSNKGVLTITTPALTHTGKNTVEAVYTGPGKARATRSATVTVR